MSEGKFFMAEGGLIELTARLKFITDAVGKLAEPAEGTVDVKTLSGLHCLLGDLERLLAETRKEYYVEWDERKALRKQLEQCRAM